MSGLIDRIQDRTARSAERPRVLDVRGSETETVLDALSSETRRSVFRTLYDDPATPSEIARRVDTSVQNVNYHLSSLEAAGLIEPIGARYSEKGNEMTVYGPTNDPLVFVGDEELRPDVQRSLADVVGGLGLLAAASLLVQWGAERLVAPAVETGAVGPASRSLGGETSRETLAWIVFEVVEPGVLFFFGSLAIVALVVYAFET